MSRVFVSCAYRDRSVGRRIVEILRGLGHEVLDDLGDSRSSTWWDRVVRGIEGSDVFLAVASRSYASAHSCHLAAEHAAGTEGLRILRLDVGEADLDGCHPAVTAAEGLRLDPDDPAVGDRLADALLRARQPEAEPEAADEPDPEDEDADEPERELAYAPEPRRARSRLLRADVAVLVVALLCFGLVVAFTVRHLGSPEPTAGEAAPAEVSSSPTPVSVDLDAEESAAVADLLSVVRAAATLSPEPLLPPDSCAAGEAGRVVCQDPAPEVGAVVLERFPAATELYAAYGRTVSGLAGGTVPENTGNCSFEASEGEVSWNLDGRHSRDFPVALQVLGGLDPGSEAAGRLFCTSGGGVTTLVWTEDARLLATVSGRRADEVVGWWSAVHLQLACVSRDCGV